MKRIDLIIIFYHHSLGEPKVFDIENSKGSRLDIENKKSIK